MEWRVSTRPPTQFPLLLNLYINTVHPFQQMTRWWHVVINRHPFFSFCLMSCLCFRVTSRTSHDISLSCHLYLLRTPTISQTSWRWPWQFGGVPGRWFAPCFPRLDWDYGFRGRTEVKCHSQYMIWRVHTVHVTYRHCCSPWPSYLSDFLSIKLLFPLPHSSHSRSGELCFLSLRGWYLPQLSGNLLHRKSVCSSPFVYLCNPFILFYFLNFKFIFRQEGRRKGGRETSMCGCLSCVP